ncbi:CAP domain-containing protein [Streptomyces sp. NPDC001744]|uniref:CAP domain-containing protein n=1 Tax=Streptomyces sp. NPDC001744 TaxID=3364606 RepID=UPI0036C0FDED
MDVRHGTELVRAARDGDPRAQDRLLTHYLPLVHNLVGRATNEHRDAGGAVRETMLRALGGLGGLRAPDGFRSWLVAVAADVVRDRQGRWHAGPPADPAPGRPDADFVDLAVARLNLSGQERETAEATRWLEPEHGLPLSLWWLECTGDLARHEVESALRLSPEHTAAHIRRMRKRLDAARVVVRALRENPPCPALWYELDGWDGRPTASWRRRIARHVHGCLRCLPLADGLHPVEALLAGLLLVPPAEPLLTAVREGAGLGPAAAAGPRGPHGYEPMGASPGHERTGTFPGYEPAETFSGYGREESFSGHGQAGPPPGHEQDAPLSGYEPVESPGAGPSPVPGARGARGTRGARRRKQQRLVRRHAVAAGMAVVAVTGGAFALSDGSGRRDVADPGALRAATAGDLPLSPPQPATALAATTTPPPGTIGPSGPRASASPVSPGPSATPTTAAPRTSTPAPPRSDRAATRAPVPKVTARPTATSSPAPTPARTTATPKKDPGSASAEQQVIDLVNAERAKAGCGPVTGNSLLALAARGHSDDMAARDFFDHTNPEGAGPGERFTAVGYGWTTYGENISKGRRTAEEVMAAWMNSPGHRANILNCSFTEMGVGLHTEGWYWTQTFGAR